MAPSLVLSPEVETLCPDWMQLEETLGFRPAIDLKALPISVVRENVTKGALATDALFPPPVFEGLLVEDRYVDSINKEKILVRVYRPGNSMGSKLPVCIFYHGGGFVLGDVDREDSLCRTICFETKSVVVSVGYRHAPEHPFPIPVEDSYNAVLWVFDNIVELGGDPTLVFTGGNSAGANLATVMVRRLRDSGRKEKIAAQVLRVPVTCHPSVFPQELAAQSSSYQKFTDAPILPKRVMDDFWELYNPGDKAASLDASPLLANDFRDFPPTYISVCGCDPLRDQGFEYAKKLAAAGVDVKFEVMPGYPHGHNMWPQIKGCAEAMTMLIDAVKWAVAEARAKTT